MNRKINLFATQRLVELLSNINHQIAFSLTESIRYRNNFPVSYLDFGSTNDTVSFITRNKYDDIQRNNPNDWQAKVWNEKRGDMKIGKIIRMFYEGHFPVSHPKGQQRPKPDVDIESFVNKFKAERDKDVNYDRFEVVSGKDFHKWYSHESYSRFVHEETTLGRSCLRYTESSKFLNMYSKNPETFKMLILKDDANKLRGRANIWNLDKPEGRIYMDRIYSVNDFDVELFKSYAKERGWLYKEAQTYGWQNNIVDSKTDERFKWDELTLLASIKNAPGGKYKYYPYFDTLCVFNPVEKTLTNDGRLRVLEPHLLLTDYQGHFHNEVDGRERVFSTVYNEYIVRDECVFAEIDNTWVYESDTVYVHNSGGKTAYRNSDKIAESYIYKRKWFMKDSATYSEYLGTHIHNESVRIAFLDEEKTKEVKIHYRMVGQDFEEVDGVILKKKINPNQDQFSKHYKGSKYDQSKLEQMLQSISGSGSSQSVGRASRNRRDAFTFDVESDLDDNPWGFTSNVRDEVIAHGVPIVDEPTPVDPPSPRPTDPIAYPATPTPVDPIADEPTPDLRDSESTEEDSDILNGLNLDSLDDGFRDYFLSQLEESRRHRQMFGDGPTRRRRPSEQREQAVPGNRPILRDREAPIREEVVREDRPMRTRNDDVVRPRLREEPDVRADRVVRDELIDMSRPIRIRPMQPPQQVTMNNRYHISDDMFGGDIADDDIGDDIIADEQQGDSPTWTAQQDTTSDGQGEVVDGGTTNGQGEVVDGGTTTGNYIINYDNTIRWSNEHTVNADNNISQETIQDMYMRMNAMSGIPGSRLDDFGGGLVMPYNDDTATPPDDEDVSSSDGDDVSPPDDNG